MNKENIFNEKIRKVLDILEVKFDMGTRPTALVFPDGTKGSYFSHEENGDIKFLAGIWMSDLTNADLSIESCWDVLSILSTRIEGLKVIGKFKTGYKNEKYEDLASKVDEPPPIFEVLLPENFIEISQKIRNNLLGGKIEPTYIMGKEITEIDLLEDKTGNKRITVYVNVDYARPLEVNRGKNWGMMYELADIQSVPYKKSFFDYFNSNKTNPLYSKHAFKVTQILKREYEVIKPKVRIGTISQKKVSQRLKKA